MKRSEINREIRKAEEFFASFKFFTSQTLFFYAYFAYQPQNPI